jgi:7,8-dihydroneopterin aldolase/epimerase/oxygenase
MSATHIHLPQLTLQMIIGVYPHERAAPQRIDLALSLRLALCPATRSDLLDDTLDYDLVIERARALAASQQPQLLEHFAGVLADDLLLRFSVLESVSIRLGKSIGADAIRVEVIHERTRGDND